MMDAFAGCPAHFLATQEAAYKVLQLASVRASGHLEGHEEYWSHDRRYFLHVGPDHGGPEVRTALSLTPGTH